MIFLLALTAVTTWSLPTDLVTMQNAFVFSRNGPKFRDIYFLQLSKDSSELRRHHVKQCAPCPSLNVCRARQVFASNHSPKNNFKKIEGHKFFYWKHEDVESIPLAPHRQRFTCSMLMQPYQREGSIKQYYYLRDRIPHITGQEIVGNSEERSKSSYDLTWLINGSIVHDSTKNKGKQVIFDQSMRAMLPTLERQGIVDTWKHPVSFVMDLRSAGKCRVENVPCFCIGKRERDAPGLLVPNPYFVEPDQWDMFANHMHTIALASVCWTPQSRSMARCLRAGRSCETSVAWRGSRA